jgi:hypothetical protein
MFDLDEQLRRWRRETEATLAFYPDEIDELEDHLKFAVEQAAREGASPENAWHQAVARLGASPSLALEFAKSKLMPALFHLLHSWLKPGLLLVIVGLLEGSIFHLGWPNADGSPILPDATFWIMIGVSFAALLSLLPGRSSKIAFLMGIGNAFCLVPLLHLLMYNPIGDRIVGAGWSRMSPPFGVLPITLSLFGLVLVNGWGWSRIRANRQALPAVLAIAATIVLVLTVSPFVSELIGNLSVRDIYSMPTAADIRLTGDAKSDFLKWKFVLVLLDCVFLIASWLPLVLLGVMSLGIASVQGVLRFLGLEKPSEHPVFPFTNELPWIMTLAASGFCWVMASSVEPNLNRQILETEKSVHLVAAGHIGYVFIVISSALVFLLCAYELTRKLMHASSLRPFYAWMLIVLEAAVLLGVVIFSPAVAGVYALNDPAAHGIARSAQPAWLWWMTVGAGTVLVLRQAWRVRKKAHIAPCEISLWKFDGDDLVQFGSQLGLILACSGLILMMVALVLAFESVAMISAMIAWGNSIKNPETNHFDPSNYVNLTTTVHYPTPLLVFWIYSGISYVSICLVIGLTVAIALSGLEFIRFNSFRLYRAKKASRPAPGALALNE